MSARVLDGRQISTEIREELKQRVEALQQKGIAPSIVGVLVGDDPGSSSYVGLKERAAGQVGLEPRMLRLPEDTAEAELLSRIEELNADASVHGIFVQLPLPSHVNEGRVLAAVSPQKDVDGFHPLNIGQACLGQQAFLPATPIGIYEILLRTGYGDLRGKHVVIVNVDSLVGKPLASILSQGSVGANVTLCHPTTRDLQAYTRLADVLVVAVNSPGFITADMVKKGVVGVDFGSTYVEDSSTRSGQRVVGDLDFQGLQGKAEALTPVPGGVGPMTVTMLLANTVTAAEHQAGISP